MEGKSMISLIRMQSQEHREKIWDNILDNLDQLKEAMAGKGQLLYLTERARQQDVSLFVHVVDCNSIGDFITKDLCKIKDITSIWAIHMMKPLFFPLPKETEHLTRFSITAKVFPTKLLEVYEKLVKQLPQDKIEMAYIAFTFHLFAESIIFSLLAENTNFLERYVRYKIDKMPGVIGTKINCISKTKPLISYKEWKKYALQHSIVPSWDSAHMIKSFQI
jgi:hypothetical protein